MFLHYDFNVDWRPEHLEPYDYNVDWTRDTPEADVFTL